MDNTTESAMDGQKQVEFAARALEFQEANLAGAKGGLDQATADLKDGTQSRAALENIQTSVRDSEYSANVARANFLRTWADFVSSVGVDPILAKVPAEIPPAAWPPRPPPSRDPLARASARRG